MWGRRSGDGVRFAVSEIAKVPPHPNPPLKRGEEDYRSRVAANFTLE